MRTTGGWLKRTTALLLVSLADLNVETLRLAGELDLAFDHRRIVSDGIEHVRVKLEHSVLATAFCGPTFTITDLQDVYETVWGMPLDPRNFYRKIKKTDGFIVPAGSARKAATGRPARLFRAGPREVLYPPVIRPVDSPNGEKPAQ
ncbi:hypothetical protein ABGB14_22755 [Nonomuraea sp. B10E15]|uniref:NUDIX hydrolase n=1 Tax=Nonomuraea sp. B10E15 TaxID=3153560 RepID=UPI00325DE72C